MKSILKVNRHDKKSHGSGGFGIEILWPGSVQKNTDSGIGAIGRIDHANIEPGTVIAMHPHKNDEILTYIRKGRMLHLDTVGNEEEITNTRLMLMNAGHTFQHEERVLGNDREAMQCLQIFVRPATADLPPMVQFHDFVNPYSLNKWRGIAGPANAPLLFRAPAWLHDVRLEKGQALNTPDIPVDSLTRILYVFEGKASIGDVTLSSGEAAIISDDADYAVVALENSDVVLFTTDTSVQVFRNGMFSGNMNTH